MTPPCLLRSLVLSLAAMLGGCNFDWQAAPALDGGKRDASREPPVVGALPGADGGRDAGKNGGLDASRPDGDGAPRSDAARDSAQGDAIVPSGMDPDLDLDGELDASPIDACLQDRCGAPCDAGSCNEAAAPTPPGCGPTQAICGGKQPYCAGERCVECRAASDCPAPDNECRVASCVQGSCGSAARQTGDRCATGYCSAAQSCVACTADAHCTSASAPVCNTATNRCVRCNAARDCSGGEACQNNECVNLCGNGRPDPGEHCDDGNDNNNDECADCVVARCGDGYVRPGLEQCDFGSALWRSTCSDFCKRLVYPDCANQSDCGDLAQCTTLSPTTRSTCLPGCTNDGQCPTMGDHTAKCNFHLCMLECKGGVCPDGMECVRDYGLLDRDGTPRGTINVCVGRLYTGP